MKNRIIFKKFYLRMKLSFQGIDMNFCNFRNFHHCSDANPHVTKNSRFQQGFSIKIWPDIFIGHTIDPFILPNRLTGEIYLSFLENDLPG